MGFFKDLKKRVRGMQNQMQPPMSPQMPPPFMRRRQAPGTVLDLETGLPPVRLPEITENIGNNRIQDDFNMIENSTFTNPRDMPGYGGSLAPDKFMPGGGMRLPDYERYKEGEPVEPQRNLLRRPRRLPQIIPERMPSPRPTPRFFGGGLGSIFSRLLNQRARERMSPPLPRAPLPMPMPERMPMERFPIMRPQFAEGEGVDINKIIADQGAREGISPAERKAQSIREFLGETGRTVSNRDAELYGMGVLSFEDIMQRAEPITNRNLEQQEQMFFPDSGSPIFNRISGRTISNKDLNELNSLEDILEDLEKKN